jgi:cytochrome c peroxidase
MRSTKLGIGVAIGLLAGLAWMLVRPAPAATPSPTAVDVYERGLRRLDSALVSLDAAMSRGDRAASLIAFRNARRDYKRVELFVEYYGSGRARELNGVSIPKAEDEDPETPLAPVGLQMIEGTLFPNGDSAAIVGARHYIPYMRLAVRALARAGVDTMPGDAYVFDAMRHELARVASLGIAGFDATLSGDAMRESAEAVDGIREVVAVYAPRREGATAPLPPPRARFARGLIRQDLTGSS